MVSLEWINLRFPNGFVHPFVFRGRAGREHERLLATVPKGVIVDGMDVGGYSLSVFATRWQAGEHRVEGEPAGRTVPGPWALPSYHPIGRAGTVA